MPSIVWAGCQCYACRWGTVRKGGQANPTASRQPTLLPVARQADDFDNLDYSSTVSHEDGTAKINAPGGGNPFIMKTASD